MRWVLAIAAPAVVIVLWAVLAAPTSPRRLADPWLFVLQLGVLLAGAALLVVADRPAWGWTLGALTVVVVVLDRMLSSTPA